MTLVFNEVQVANIDQYLDGALCYGSWIELYNPTSESIPLKGTTITDGVNEFRFTSLSVWGSVEPGGFKVLYFGHSQAEGNYGDGAKTQIPFKLEPEGGTISPEDELLHAPNSSDPNSDLLEVNDYEDVNDVFSLLKLLADSSKNKFEDESCLYPAPQTDSGVTKYLLMLYDYNTTISGLDVQVDLSDNNDYFTAYQDYGIDVIRKRVYEEFEKDNKYVNFIEETKSELNLTD